MRRLSNLSLHALFGLIAGGIYMMIELAWRGYTHWTMMILAAVVFVCAGILDELDKPLKKWQQVIIGTIIATALEFVTGIIVNLWLGLNIWDYSDQPGNILGQICPLFTLAWAFLMIVSIKLENFMHTVANKIFKLERYRGDSNENI